MGVEPHDIISIYMKLKMMNVLRKTVRSKRTCPGFFTYEVNKREQET